MGDALILSEATKRKLCAAVNLVMVGFFFRNCCGNNMNLTNAVLNRSGSLTLTKSVNISCLNYLVQCLVSKIKVFLNIQILFITLQTESNFYETKTKIIFYYC